MRLLWGMLTRSNRQCVIVISLHGSCFIRSLPCRIEKGDVSELRGGQELLPFTKGGTTPLLHLEQ